MTEQLIRKQIWTTLIIFLGIPWSDQALHRTKNSLKLGAARVHTLSAEERVRLNKQLFFAARAGDIGTVKRLIEAGAHVNMQTARGNTPLMVAVLHGQLLMVKTLLDYGANVYVCNNGWTALRLALYLNQRWLVNVLTNHVISHGGRMGYFEVGLMLFGHTLFEGYFACHDTEGRPYLMFQVERSLQHTTTLYFDRLNEILQINT